MSTIIAYDLGTGGAKASLYSEEGMCLKSTFLPYQTFYPDIGWHEQSPVDWWDAVAHSTQKLLSDGDVDKDDIRCLALSGHSLGVVPIDENGRLLREKTPIWSDTRAQIQAKKFFSSVDQDERRLGQPNRATSRTVGFSPAGRKSASRHSRGYLVSRGSAWWRF
jgi:xylulokinase